MKLVTVESPFASRKPDGTWDPEGVEENLRYVRAAMRDCLKRDEAPYASHALYTQLGVLNDQIPEERALGINAGFAFNTRTEKSIFYIDRGFSSGMRQGLENALHDGRFITVRSLPEWEGKLSIAGRIAFHTALGEVFLEVNGRK